MESSQYTPASVTPILFSPRPTTLSSIAVETNNARKPADDAAREKRRMREREKEREREREKEKITRRRKNVKGKRKERESVCVEESRQQADELLDPAYPAYCVADDQ